MVSTWDADLDQYLREFRNYGKSIGPDRKIAYSKGFNFRMSEWDAAVALHQVLRYEEIIEARNQDFNRLFSILPPLVIWGGVSNCYKYIVSREMAEYEGLKRFTGQVYSRSDQLVKSLKIKPENGLPNSDWVADNHVCLPLGEGMYRGMTNFEIMKYLRGVI
jgi:dTDP-4-amino-4,6-dideoxygalactose transaminase